MTTLKNIFTDAEINTIEECLINAGDHKTNNGELDLANTVFHVGETMQLEIDMAVAVKQFANNLIDEMATGINKNYMEIYNEVSVLNSILERIIANFNLDIGHALGMAMPKLYADIQNFIEFDKVEAARKAVIEKLPVRYKLVVKVINGLPEQERIIAVSQLKKDVSLFSWGQIKNHLK